jgi:ATP-dependent exoDNAse (exonuclease V) alpha subunit
MTPEQLLSKRLRYACIFGPAGSGKSFLVRAAIKADPKFGILCATTGVAARILGADVRTIHSELGIFDLNSLKQSYDKGDLFDVMTNLRKSYARIIVDEASMLSRRMFEILLPACEAVGLGLILCGDMLQLPPIPENKTGWNQKTEWLFDSKLWPRFAKHIVTLETQYRFANEDYIRGLNCLRAGKGLEAIPHLLKAGVTFLPKGTSNKDFDGTCITATKSKRDIINNARFDALKTAPQIYKTVRKGPQLPDWGEIQNSIALKVGARVMILRNLYDGKDDDAKLVQANGELGTVTELLDKSVMIERDDHSVVEVEMFEAHNGGQHGGHDGQSRTRVVDRRPNGFIEYMPLTLAYACNAHKVQGLSLFHPTRVVMEDFFTSAAMVYVACSRVADPSHLTIVGGDTMSMVHGSDIPEEMCEVPRVGKLCNMDPAVKEFV